MIEVRFVKERLQMFDADLPQQVFADDDALFLHAYDGEKPVAQIGLWNDGVMWWADYFAIIPEYRGGNIRVELINCLHHLMLQLGVLLFWSEVVKRPHQLDFAAIFSRDAVRFKTGKLDRIVRETEKVIVTERDLTQLDAAVQRGEVPLIVLPYSFEFVKP